MIVPDTTPTDLGADDVPTPDETVEDTTPELADQVAAAVLAVDGVHDLHGGLAGDVATLLPGRRVAGVRLREDGCEIHVVLAWGAPVADTASAVRAAVDPLVDHVPVDVVVADVAPPGAVRATDDAA